MSAGKSSLDSQKAILTSDVINQTNL